MTEQKTARSRNSRSKTKNENTPTEVTNVDVTEEVATETKVTPTKVEVTKEELKDTDKITVMNNTTGRYGYTGRSGYSFELEEYGDTARIPFSELREMVASRQKVHITKAFIVILNDEAIEELNLNKLYQTILDDEGVESLLKDATKIKELLPVMPPIMRETAITIARNKYKNGQLTDLTIINAIKESTNINIME